MRAKVVVQAFAKINLALRIGTTRQDGFHEVQTIFQAVDLVDTLTCVARTGDFRIRIKRQPLLFLRCLFIWPFAGFYENKLFNSNMLSNFVSITSLQGSKGNSVPPSEGLISLESLESGNSLTTEKPAKGQLPIKPSIPIYPTNLPTRYGEDPNYIS